MPRIPTYEPGQVGPVQVTGARLRGADNNGGVGGAVAQGLGTLGATLGQAAQLQEQVDIHYADAAAKDADNQVAAAYAKLGYDGPEGYFNLTGRAALDGRQAFEDGLSSAVAGARGQLKGSPLAQQMFDQSVAGRKVEWTRNVGQHVFQQTRAYAVDAGTSRAGLAFDAAVHTALNADESDKNIATGQAEIANTGALLGWSPERIAFEKQNKTSAARSDVAVTIIDAGVNGPAAAAAYVDLHRSEFTGDDLDRVHQRITATERARAADLAREAAIQKAQFGESVATAKADAARGLDVSARLPAMIQHASATGDTSTASELKGLLGDQGFARQYQQATPLEREQRIGQLASLKKPSEAQQQELHWLREHGGALDSQFNADPAGYMIASGHAAPPIGPARAQWADAMSKATGRPVPPLTKEEVAQYQARASAGDGGQDGVLSQIDRLPAGASRAAAARQIAPDDLVFQHLAQIDRTYRPTIRAGAEALKANPILLNQAKNPAIAKAYADADAQLRLALKEFSPKDQNAVMQVSRQWLAGKVSHGKWGVDPASIGRLYQVSLRVGLGGGTNAQGVEIGGLGDWNGHPVVLPEGSTNSSFAGSVRAYLGKRVPTNPDGSTMPITGIAPVMIGPNTYRFEGADGRVVADRQRKPIIMYTIGAHR